VGDEDIYTPDIMLPALDGISSKKPEKLIDSLSFRVIVIKYPVFCADSFVNI